ncbi:MAG: protoporphyrinogen oxidase, partial [Candidatus Omnitrophota bacterium]
MPTKRVAVIGGGITGLACAHRLTELAKESGAPLDVVLFESASRLGGIFESENREGFLLEKGPDSFISEKPAALNLVKRLGLEKEILGTRPGHRRSFVAQNGNLTPLPEGFYLIAPTRIRPFLASPLMSFPGKMRVLSEMFVPARRTAADESVASFVRRRFGQEALERVGQPMLAGIYTGDPELLSLSATMPRFQELERRHGSVIRGLVTEAKKSKENLNGVSGPRYGLFLTFRNGIETLTKELARRLPAGAVKLNSEIKDVSYNWAKGKWRLVADHGETEADAVCLAVSAAASGRLLTKTSRKISSQLGALVHESVVTVNFGFRREDIAHPLDGFGFVVPRTEQSPLLACSFSSQKFEGRAPEGFALLRAFAGGAFGKKFLEFEDNTLRDIVRRELSSFLGIGRPPLFAVVRRHRNAMVQYRLGHEEWVSRVRNELKEFRGLYLAGPAFKGAGIPDCVE